MRVHVSLGIAMSLLSTAGLAHAGQTIASPPVLNHGPGGCYVRNVGLSPVSVTVQISGEDGTPLTASFDGCSAPLPPGSTCVVLTPVNFSFRFLACSATASGNAKGLRGTMETRAGAQVYAEDLR